MMVRVTDLSTLPTFDDISAASNRIADGIFHTPCFEAPALSDRCGCTVFTKDEHLQRTGSFKERALQRTLAAEPRRQTTRSGGGQRGNHALASRTMAGTGIPITVCMPIHALVKQRRCELLREGASLWRTHS